jgi:tetratricopeptide (TPR) repeat protein
LSRCGRAALGAALSLLVACAALAPGAPAQAVPDAAATLQEFTASFGDGAAALREGAPSRAHRAFTRCAELVASLPAERRAAAQFAAELFLAETTWRAGQLELPAVHAGIAAVVATGKRSGAWTGAGAEALRLRGLVLLWQTAPAGAAEGLIDADDRAWLLRSDFFANEPRRLADLHAPARVLRLAVATGSVHEAAALRDLVAQEGAFAVAAAQGPLDPDALVWRHLGLAALASYHAERRAFDRAEVYVGRLPAGESLPLRAWLALQREDHDTAARLARQLVAARDPAGVQLLAEALEAGGEPAAALPHYEQALAAASAPRARAAAANGRGDCLLALGRHDDAAGAYARALAAADGDELGALAERAETHKDLGRLAEARGDAAAACTHFLTALAVGEQAREHLLGDPFGGSWLAMHGDQTTALDGVVRTFAAAGQEPWVVLHALELARARGALDLAAGGGFGLDAELLQQVVDRRLQATDAAAVEAAAAELDALRAEAAGAARRTQVPSAAVLRAFAAAQPHATFLCWWLGREQTWLFAVRGADVRCLELPPPRQCRDATAAAFAAVAMPQGDPRALAAAAACLLPASVHDLLAGVVMVVPAPAMVRTPFAALPVDGEPLGVRTVLVQTPSLAVAAVLAQRAPPPQVRVAVVEAAARAPLPQRLGLDPLVFAAREAAAVVASWPGAEHLRGADASLAGLRTLVAGAPPSLLHVAAHAVDCRGLPSQSLLLLDDGPLGMAALGELSLPGAVVVFSACAAAVGEQRGHEGIAGLVDGAFAAGARAVVAPVAAVNQQATADFMAQVHHALAHGSELAAALQTARRALAAAPQYAHPHHWGAFAVFGPVPPASAGSDGTQPGIGWSGLLGAGLVAGLATLVAARRRRAARGGRTDLA